MSTELDLCYDITISTLDRVLALLNLSAKDPKGGGSDVLRAAVVLAHASLEDFLRTIASKLLPLADGSVLNQIPLAGCNGDRGKLRLGDLTQHRGKTIDEVLSASVAEYLDRSNFNSTTDIVSFLENDLGTPIPPDAANLLPKLAELIERRHLIVHRGDRLEIANPTKLRPITAAQVTGWALAASGFIQSVLATLPKNRTP